MNRRQAALRDVSDEINELAFRDAMSRALSALEAGADRDGRKRAYSRRPALKPDAEVVRNTQQELAQTQQRLWLEGQRQAVAMAESNEDWSAAVAIYQQGAGA